VYVYGSIFFLSEGDPLVGTAEPSTAVSERAFGTSLLFYKFTVGVISRAVMMSKVSAFGDY